VNAAFSKLSSPVCLVFCSIPSYSWRVKKEVAIPEALESPRRLIGIDEVLRLHPMPKSKPFRPMNAGKFPKQERNEDGTTSVLWFLDVTLTYIAGLRTSPTPAWKHEIGNAPIEPAPPAATQSHRQEPAPSACSKSKPHPLKSRSDAGNPRTSFVIQQLTSGAQAIYLEPATGSLFAAIGQMPALQTGQVSDAIAAPTRQALKGVRS
jgi:hypothetical protein